MAKSLLTAQLSSPIFIFKHSGIYNSNIIDFQINWIGNNANLNKRFRVKETSNNFVEILNIHKLDLSKLQTKKNHSQSESRRSDIHH